MKKTSLIFGGTKGIGWEISKTLVKRGDKVIVASRNIKNSKKIISVDLEDLMHMYVSYHHDLDLPFVSSVFVKGLFE